MRFTPIEPPRQFGTGPEHRIVISEVGRIALQPDEQISLLTQSKEEYDIVRKSWGFYATPSINSRLKLFGWRTCLVISSESRLYVMLVSGGKESEFAEYCDGQKLKVLLWLDKIETSSLYDTFQETEQLSPLSNNQTCLCGCRNWVLKHVFIERPPREIAFAAYSQSDYRRELLRCEICGHFRSVHDMGSTFIYDGDYTQSNYGSAGLKTAFDAVVSLPPEKSDNHARVRYVVGFIESWLSKIQHASPVNPSLLDIGSGLCVFLYGIHKFRPKWNLLAMDSDSVACEHAQNVAGINTLCGDITRTYIESRFDCVSLVKVLEHSDDPHSILSRAGELLNAKGLVYIEVPDGSGAWRDGPDREEFTIDHPHVFSSNSLLHLIEKSGLNLVELQVLTEPSSKRTIRAFATGLL